MQHALSKPSSVKTVCGAVAMLASFAEGPTVLNWGLYNCIIDGRGET
jgi:hypothetical protein